MKIKLDCSKEHIPYLQEKLTQAGFQIDENGRVVVVDNPTFSFRKKDPFHDFKSILFMKAFGTNIHIHHLGDQEPIIIQDKLYELENKYKDHGFIRVNKSQIVNIRFIKDIDPWIGQKYILTLKNERKIDVNRTYYKEFKAYLKL